MTLYIFYILEKIGPWWIAVGLVTGIVGIAVGYMFDKIGMSDTGK